MGYTPDNPQSLAKKRALFSANVFLAFPTAKGGLVFCKVEGCEKPNFRRRLCRGHYERTRHGQDVNTPLRERSAEPLPPREAMLREATRRADADSDQEYALRERLLIRYATQYVANKLGFETFRDAREFVLQALTLKAHNTNKPKSPAQLQSAL